MSNIEKKKTRGRPPTDATAILVRVPPEILDALDSWLEQQPHPQTRPQGILQLVELGLRTRLQAADNVNEAQSYATQASKLAAELGLKAKR